MNGFGGNDDPSNAIKMLLARSGGQSQGMGLPFSGLPFSGLPQMPKATMFSTDFPQQQSPRGPAPEPQFAPMPEPQRVERIPTGSGLGEGSLEDYIAKISASLNPKKAGDDGMKKIRDALAASRNALASIYANPNPSPAGDSVTNPDGSVSVSPDGSLEQYRYNLGNIRTSNIDWQGKTTPFKGFESFATPEAGAQAMFKNLSSYAKGTPNMTLAGAIAKWAPPSENKTDNYIKYVAEKMGVDKETLLSDILSDPATAAKMMYWMGTMEHGQNLPKVFTPEFLAKVIAGV